MRLNENKRQRVLEKYKLNKIEKSKTKNELTYEMKWNI